MKKILCAILAAAMLCLAMAGCSKSSTTSSTTSADSTAATTAAASSDSSGKSLKVALVVNQPFGDNGAMDDLAAGAEKASKEFGVQVTKLESDTATFEDDIRAMAQQGYNLIITTFGYMTDATKAVAQEYPDTMFCAVYQTINDGTTTYKNVWDVEFHGEQAFYIAGYMAGLYTKSNKVAIQVGGEEPTPNAEANGFMSGVYASNTNATCEFAYAGGYGDPATAKEKAKAMIADGCDFIQNDSGASNAGVVEAAQEAKIFTAGEITDYYDTYKGFLGIIGIGFGNVAYEAIKDLVNNQYPGGEHSIYGLAEGGYYMNWDSYQRFADANPDFADVLAKGKEIEKKIEAKEITVEYNTDSPSWSAITGK